MCVANWALGVTEKSEHKAEAMKFIEYLLSGADGKDGSICADLAVTQSAFPNSTLAKPDYSGADEVSRISTICIRAAIRSMSSQA